MPKLHTIGFFESSYEKNAILQKGFNAHIINDLVEYILRVCPEATQRPIKILDLCCGDGGSTVYLFSELLKRKIKVEKLVGTDISQAQIDVANRAYGGLSRVLTFHCEDALKTKDHNEFDVVICLFGLHWIADIEKMASVIDGALKPDGKFVCFIPLEKPEFFGCRHSLVSTPKWSSYFLDFGLRPFIQKPQEYLTAFKCFFELENVDGITGTEPVVFSQEKFKQFLSSWMPEVRHLPEAQRMDYLNDLMQLMKERGIPDVEHASNENIIFHEQFLWVHATTKKKLVCEMEQLPRAKL
jgi:SAM-dependent methyltransferase